MFFESTNQETNNLYCALRESLSKEESISKVLELYYA